MSALRFKTNINCASCIRAITPTLNEQAGAGNWQVDTANPDKILTINSPNLSAAAVAAAIAEAGFSATPA